MLLIPFFFSPLISLAQQPSNMTSLHNDLGLTKFMANIESNHSGSDSFFSFFFKVNGGFVLLDNNVFYNSNQGTYVNGNLGVIQHLYSTNGEVENPVFNAIFINKTDVNKIKELAIASKFFDSETFLSKGFSNIHYSLYMAVGNKTNTIVWNNNEDIPKNMKVLVDLFRETCNKMC
jgi:hypothetical protein